MRTGEGHRAVEGNRPDREQNEARSSGSSGLLSGETGEICPKEGVWGVVGDVQGTATIREGERFPEFKDRRVRWVWCRDE
jgi:hypothetical protein